MRSLKKNDDDDDDVDDDDIPIVATKRSPITHFSSG